MLFKPGMMMVALCTLMTTLPELLTSAQLLPPPIPPPNPAAPLVGAATAPLAVAGTGLSAPLRLAAASQGLFLPLGVRHPQFEDDGKSNDEHIGRMATTAPTIRTFDFAGVLGNMINGIASSVGAVTNDASANTAAAGTAAPATTTATPTTTANRNASPAALNALSGFSSFLSNADVASNTNTASGNILAPPDAEVIATREKATAEKAATDQQNMELLLQTLGSMNQQQQQQVQQQQTLQFRQPNHQMQTMQLQVPLGGLQAPIGGIVQQPTAIFAAGGGSPYLGGAGFGFPLGGFGPLGFVTGIVDSVVPLVNGVSGALITTGQGQQIVASPQAQVVGF